MAAEEGNVARD